MLLRIEVERKPASQEYCLPLSVYIVSIKLDQCPYLATEGHQERAAILKASLAVEQDKELAWLSVTDNTVELERIGNEICW